MDRARVKKVLAVSLSAVVVVGAVVLAVKEEQAGRAAPVATASRSYPADPLATELAHCQALGEAGARDAGCLAAWAESRRRFLAPSARPSALRARPQVGRPEDE